MAITVTSSQFKIAAVTVRAEKGMLSIRAFDKSRPGSAVRVVIPETDLLALLAQVHRLTHAPDTVEELTDIDDVARGFGLEPVPLADLPGIDPTIGGIEWTTTREQRQPEKPDWEDDAPAG